MTKKELEYKINEVKSDYIRIQGDLEKLESVGRNTEKSEKRLEALEIELAELNKQLAVLEK
ncbi:SE1832 family protein [Bacillus sp. AK031]